MNKLNLLLLILLLPFIILIRLFTPNSACSRRRITGIIRRKYPKCNIIDIKMQYIDWSSTVKTANKSEKATDAVAVIEIDGETRTLHFSFTCGIWHITHNAPDRGKNVPEGKYYMENKRVTLGPKSDLDSFVRDMWVIPEENGELCKKIENFEGHYSVHYIDEMYKTANGGVYIFDKKTFEWNETDLTYSKLDYYGNYTEITKAEAEDLIERYKKSRQ